MTQLPPEAASLLAKARREHNPTDADAERVRRDLYAKLGIAAAIAPSAATVMSSKAAASAGTQLATGSTGALGALGAQAVGKTGTLLFGLKASKVILAVVTLSGVASVPLMMRSDVRPRASDARCTTEPCPPSEGDAAAIALVSSDPRVEPTPTAEELDDRRAADRRARRHERRQQRVAQTDRARDSRASRVDEDEHDAPTPGDRAQVAHDPTISSRATAASGATHTVNGAPASASGAAHGGVNDAPASESDATEVPAPKVDAPSAPTELALIRGALTNLRDGAPQRALSLLSEHGEAYPEGAFASERRGLRIVALCASGRLDEGRKERVVFLRREGSAPVAERVRHACQEAPGK
ncbi:MAG: hypothetical protein ABW252_20250 [Polyangiales bacterium]